MDSFASLQLYQNCTEGCGTNHRQNEQARRSHPPESQRPPLGNPQSSTISRSNNTMLPPPKNLLPTETTKFEIPKTLVFDRMIEFLAKETFSDVTLKVDGVELKAHKIMLAAQSPVFSAMFENTMMREARENYVIIEDIDIDVAKQMLEFVYSNERPSRIDEFALELIAVAQKYQMERLKVMCEEVATNQLSVSNVIDILVCADLYESKELKKKSINLIKEHRRILNSENFRKFEETQWKLAIEVLKELLGLIN